MKIRLILASIMLGFLMASSAEAMPNVPPPITKAPEISVASGGSAIAFLTGILLLAGERARTRRS
jgi:hypothetical protein